MQVITNVFQNQAAFALLLSHQMVKKLRVKFFRQHPLLVLLNL